MAEGRKGGKAERQKGGKKYGQIAFGSPCIPCETSVLSPAFIAIAMAGSTLRSDVRNLRALCAKPPYPLLHSLL